jgi:hypothetical protein
VQVVALVSKFKIRTVISVAVPALSGKTIGCILAIVYIV